MSIGRILISFSVGILLLYSGLEGYQKRFNAVRYIINHYTCDE